MLIAVAAVSAAIGQGSTAVIVGFLVVVNVVIGTRQEMLARKSVDALATMQEPQSRVRRDGTLEQVPAHDLVPGDIVELEAGDIVPADGRLLRTATMETQEAALTGESAPIGKDVRTLADADVPLGRPREHGVPEHLGHPRHGHDGRHRDRHDHADRHHRHAAVVGGEDEVAAAARAGHADQGARGHRVGRGGDHRGDRHRPRPVPVGPAVPGHGRRDLGHPHRPADVRAGHARVRRASAGGRQGRRRQPQRRRDARRHQLDQLRQDRDPDSQRDDGDRAVDHGPALHGRGLRVRQDRPDPAHGGHTAAGSDAAGVRPVPGQRRHGLRHR